MAMLSPLSLPSKFILKRHHLIHSSSSSSSRKNKEFKGTSFTISNTKIINPPSEQPHINSSNNKFSHHSHKYKRIHITKAQLEATSPVFFELDTSLWAPAIKGSIDILISIIIAFAITKLVRYLAAYDIDVNNKSYIKFENL